MTTIHEAAPRIVAGLAAAGFLPDASRRQLLTLGEEAGEFLGAYRRYTGKARRCGTWEEMCEELADVLITAYVTAEEMHHPLGSVSPSERMVVPREPISLFVQVGRALAAAPDGIHDDATRRLVWFHLDRVEHACYDVAHRLGIDLDLAVSLKIDRIFARGWREKTDA